MIFKKISWCSIKMDCSSNAREISEKYCLLLCKIKITVSKWDMSITNNKCNKVLWGHPSVTSAKTKWFLRAPPPPPPPHTHTHTHKEHKHPKWSYSPTILILDSGHLNFNLIIACLALSLTPSPFQDFF